MKNTSKNIFENLPNHLPEEMLETLISTPQVRIERIVSQGHKSKEGFWYEQDEDEWVVVLKGSATLRFEDQLTDLKMIAGDSINIPAKRRHRVICTDPIEKTIWLAVFYTQHD